MVKYVDFWSHPIDITKFAPLNVKSESVFDNTLDLWTTSRPTIAVVSRRTALLNQKLIGRGAGKILMREEAARKTTRLKTKAQAQKK